MSVSVSLQPQVLGPGFSLVVQISNKYQPQPCEAVFSSSSFHELWVLTTAWPCAEQPGWPCAEQPGWLGPPGSGAVALKAEREVSDPGSCREFTGRLGPHFPTPGTLLPCVGIWKQ